MLFTWAVTKEQSKIIIKESAHVIIWDATTIKKRIL